MSLNVFDQYGRHIKAIVKNIKPTYDHYEDITLSMNKPGVYYVVMSSKNKESITKKIVIIQ